MRTSIERQRPTRQPRFPYTVVRFFMAALAGMVLLQPSAAFAVSAYDLYILMLGSSGDSSHELELAGNSNRDTTERSLNTPSHGRGLGLDQDSAEGLYGKLENPRITRRPGRSTVVGNHPKPGRKYSAATPEPTAGLLFGAGILLVARRLSPRVT
jgi:hypothetical protein